MAITLELSINLALAFPISLREQSSTNLRFESEAVSLRVNVSHRMLTGD